MFQLTTRVSLAKLAGIGAITLSLIACESADNSPASPLRTGVFLDSAAVEGLGYSTATMNGKTNMSGEFSFNAGERITFSLGGLALPDVQAANTVTPVTIFGSNEAAVADLSRLLQSMDEDRITENGITLPLTVESITSDTQIDFGEQNFDAQAQALLQQVSGADATLIGATVAMDNLNQSLVDNDLVSDDCSADHPFVGRSVELSSLAHGVSGTVTVVDDCVIEVTNFNYDGGGPSVYFYGATDRNYSGDSFIIGQRLNGQRWVNDTIRLPFPEGKTLDDFNSLSVWCSDFNANFGDAFFGDS